MVVLTASALVPAVALAAGGSSRVYAPGCKKALYKPPMLVIACGDGDIYLTSLKWSSWTHASAKGNGKVHEDTCKPSCASGKFKTYKVKVALSGKKSCKKHTVFTQVTVTYGKNRPTAMKKQSFSLGCPS